MAKKWFTSKTVWAALMSFVAVIVLEATGYEIEATMQAGVLSAIMVIMRLITKSPVKI